MDDSLREAERRARTQDDAAAWLAWAAALRRAGRDLEGAAAAFEARSRGASRDEVFALGQPREGGGDALAPWPHPRGDSAGTRRSRVEGPTDRAKLLFEVELGPGPFSWGAGPIVLPDGTVVVKLERPSRESELRAFSAEGVPRWSFTVRGSVSPPIALASGEVAFTTPRELVTIDGCRGRELARTLLVTPAAAGAVEAWRIPAAWSRSVLVGDRFVGSDGVVATLRGPDGRRILARSGVAGPERCHLVGAAYRLEERQRSTTAPPLLLDPMALHGFGREGEHRWSARLAADAATATITLGRERLLALGNASIAIHDAATGAPIATRPYGGLHVALDPADEPVALAPFGPPLIAAPVVDAASRRYAAVERGDLVGLGPGGEGVLFTAPLGLERDTLAALALGPGRLYLLVLRPERPAVLCFGDA
ncbi:MAG TPA: hypothetical protein VFF73_35345 [Planctomycetota bacterium]|nr:hypothetical protein [Planctomycetota bacterium]